MLHRQDRKDGAQDHDPLVLVSVAYRRRIPLNCLFPISMVSLPGESEIQQMLADPAQRQSAFPRLSGRIVVRSTGNTRHCRDPRECRRRAAEHFLKAWRNLDDFRGGSKLSTWLYRIAVNESLDYLRKEKTRAQQADSPFLWPTAFLPILILMATGPRPFSRRP